MWYTSLYRFILRYLSLKRAFYIYENKYFERKVSVWFNIICVWCHVFADPSVFYLQLYIVHFFNNHYETSEFILWLWIDWCDSSEFCLFFVVFFVFCFWCCLSFFALGFWCPSLYRLTFDSVPLEQSYLAYNKTQIRKEIGMLVWHFGN